MKHLEFVDNLLHMGIAIRSTNYEGETKVIHNVPCGFTVSDCIVKDFEVKWDTDRYISHDATKSLIKKAIDMDTWKHSWHKEIEPGNYEEFRGIIQQKILDRAKQIDDLLTVYFILGKKISDQEEQQ